MDFFESQDEARRKTGWLVFLYGLAVVSIFGVTYLLFAGILLPRKAGTLWDPGLFVLVVLGTFLVLGAGTLWKMHELRAGGSVIADRLGGRLLQPATDDFHERRLLNVVEEMAIASGTPVPLVYLLPEEAGINAFAAGTSPEDAVIGVTRGTAEKLSRDELSGVIAHEFSHVLNGDMRLNLKLIGIVHGILVMGMIGRILLDASVRGRTGRRKDGKAGGAIALLGLGLWLIGGAGTICGNLIKAAVSRQREFLADASAVQFTRDSGGIAGALKKIGGYVFGSRLRHRNAPEASHLYFGQGVGAGMFGLMATHPPLGERIRRLDASWDGEFPAVSEEETDLSDERVASFAGSGDAAALPAIEGIGNPSPSHVQRATLLIGAIPAPVREAATEPFGARAAVHALFLGEPAVRERQLAYLAGAAEKGMSREVERLAPEVARVPPRARLVLVDLALPALRRLAPAQVAAFRKDLDALARADEKVEPLEWALLRIVRHRLEGGGPPPVRHRELADVREPAVAVLSTLARLGHDDDAAARSAFAASVATLGLDGREPLPAETFDERVIDRALDELAATPPLLKRSVLAACAVGIEHDRRVTEEECELFRAIGDSLGCPVPPVLPGQALGVTRSFAHA